MTGLFIAFFCDRVRDRTFADRCRADSRCRRLPLSAAPDGAACPGPDYGTRSGDDPGGQSRPAQPHPIASPDGASCPGPDPGTIRGPGATGKFLRVGPGPRIKSGEASLVCMVRVGGLGRHRWCVWCASVVRRRLAPPPGGEGFGRRPIFPRSVPPSIASPDGAQQPAPDPIRGRSGAQGPQANFFGSALGPGSSPGKHRWRVSCASVDRRRVAPPPGGEGFGRRPFFPRSVPPSIASPAHPPLLPRPPLHCFPGRSAAEIRGPGATGKFLRVGPGPRIKSGEASLVCMVRVGGPGRHRWCVWCASVVRRRLAPPPGGEGFGRRPIFPRSVPPSIASPAHPPLLPRPPLHCFPGRSAAEIRGPGATGKFLRVGPGPRIKSGEASLVCMVRVGGLGRHRWCVWCASVVRRRLAPPPGGEGFGRRPIFPRSVPPSIASPDGAQQPAPDPIRGRSGGQGHRQRPVGSPLGPGSRSGAAIWLLSTGERTAYAVFAGVLSPLEGNPALHRQTHRPFLRRLGRLAPPFIRSYNVPLPGVKPFSCAGPGRRAAAADPGWKPAGIPVRNPGAECNRPPGCPGGRFSSSAVRDRAGRGATPPSCRPLPGRWRTGSRRSAA